MFQPLRVAFVSAMAFGLSCSFSSFAAEPALKLMVQRGYVSGLPVLVRVERLDAAGQTDKALWNATATLEADQTGIALSTNLVRLRNGLGSAFITVTGAVDFNLTATLGEMSVTRSLRNVTNEPIVTIGGALSGTESTWSGVVQVTNDVTIPADHTLTILSNTLVLVNGVASGNVAADIFVVGTIQSLGTEDHPVTITSANAGWHWGQIRHNSAQPSLYQYTSINRAGRGAGEGHTGTVPAVRPSGSKITFDHCNLTDFASPAGGPGKIMQGNNSDLTFTHCLLARARMGPELQGTALLCSNTYFMEFRGTDDSDGIYVHSQQAGQRVLFSDCVLGFGDDDGIDTLGANLTMERCIIRDINSGVDPDGKGVSAFNGATHLKRCLIVDCITSVSAKCGGGDSALVTVNECTILGTSNSVVAAYKSNAPGPNIDFRITNSILRSLDAIKSDFGPTNFTIEYCNASEEWAGTGNQTNDALFVGAYDFHLQLDSLCIDAGNPDSPLDPDGSRIDLGAFTLVPPAPTLGVPSSAPGGEYEFPLQAFPNRNYVIEASTNTSVWTALGTFLQTNSVNLIHDPSPSVQQKFYRARLAP